MVPRFSGDGISCVDDNECIINGTSLCPGINEECVNTGGSFSCRCSPGYSLLGNGRCADVNECSAGTDNCFVSVSRAQTAHCQNSDGSFTCTCPTGYSGDGVVACTNRNECASTSSCSPHAMCNDTIGSFSCTCNAGYGGTGLVCSDIDECAGSPCERTAQCINLDGDSGRFNCVCLTGFETASGGTVVPASDVGTVRCASINECQNTSACGGHAVCIDTTSSFFCQCQSGFSAVDERECADIDECGTASCPQFSTCVNSVGGYGCTCNTGYSGWASPGDLCTNVNECAQADILCSSDATCSDMPGSFSCSCNVGFAGNGSSCSSIDECSLQVDNCASSATCADSVGSFTCACNSGWTGSGTTCVDVNECSSRRLNTCQAGEVCRNTMGSFQCVCATGTVHNTTTGICENIDECATSTSLCRQPHSHCVDTIGSFTCACSSGFQPSSILSPGLNCVDINECSSGRDRCIQRADCVNTVGSHYCCADDNPGLAAVLQVGEWAGPSTCSALAPTYCIGQAPVRLVVAWYCARSCNTCRARIAAGSSVGPTLPVPVVTTSTLPQATTTAGVIDTTIVTLDLHLDGSRISTETVLPVLQRLAVIAQVDADRLVASTFIVQSGSLQLLISGGQHSSDPTSATISTLLTNALSIAPEQIEANGVIVTVSIASSTTTPASGIQLSSSASNDTGSLSPVVLVVIVICAVILAIGAAVYFVRGKRHQEQSLSNSSTLDEIYATSESDKWTVLSQRKSEEHLARSSEYLRGQPIRTGAQGVVFVEGNYVTAAKFRGMPTSTYTNPLFEASSPGVSLRDVLREPHQAPNSTPQRHIETSQDVPAGETNTFL